MKIYGIVRKDMVIVSKIAIFMWMILSLIVVSYHVDIMVDSNFMHESVKKHATIDDLSNTVYGISGTVASSNSKLITQYGDIFEKRFMQYFEQYSNEFDLSSITVKQIVDVELTGKIELISLVGVDSSHLKQVENAFGIDINEQVVLGIYNNEEDVPTNVTLGITGDQNIEINVTLGKVVQSGSNEFEEINSILGGGITPATTINHLVVIMQLSDLYADYNGQCRFSFRHQFPSSMSVDFAWNSTLQNLFDLYSDNVRNDVISFGGMEIQEVVSVSSYSINLYDFMRAFDLLITFFQVLITVLAVLVMLGLMEYLNVKRRKIVKAQVHSGWSIPELILHYISVAIPIIFGAYSTLFTNTAILKAISKLPQFTYAGYRQSTSLLFAISFSTYVIIMILSMLKIENSETIEWADILVLYSQFHFCFH